MLMNESPQHDNEHDVHLSQNVFRQMDEICLVHFLLILPDCYVRYFNKL
jgi:hypothetical protein